MTTRTKSTKDYQQLAARFGVVRRAWKRVAVLSGLAIVVTESIGIFTAMLFLDWLYQPQPVVRIGLWMAALGGIAYFLARHVMKPLLRKIPDAQIAMYIEEHRTELDGVLITAAEFGRNRDKIGGNQAALIDAVVHEAASRSAGMSVGRVVDFSRLRKYGIGAAAGIGVYVLLGVMFPDSFGLHLGRILQPWRATNEDLARSAAAAVQAEPLRFTLSKGNTSLPRGSSFDFEATLSKAKPANDAVELYFRPTTAGAEWRKLAMPEIEKLNGFQGALPDVSEDLQFYVACGTDKSDTYRLTVYDPLIVQSLAMTTHYPDYVKQPDRVEKPSTGDVTALVGSTATLRILTSTPLKEGQIKWSDGETQAVTVDPTANATATVSFEVKQDDTYDYTLTDVNGQQAVSPAPFSVHAIPDTPPTVTVKSPQPPVLTTPLGEVNFDIEAGDDFGVEGMDLVYSRSDAKGNDKETRVPLKYHAITANDMPNAVAASYRLALEDGAPPFQPGEAITYHVEARDAKGQSTSSPIGFIIVGYYEHWATYESESMGGGLHDKTGADVYQILALIWELDNQKTQIKPDELQKRSVEIAGKIQNPDGTLHDFLRLEEQPQLMKIADIINGHIKKAHDALMTSDTGAATTQMSIAAGLIAGAGILLDSPVHRNTEDQVVVGNHFGMPKITLLEAARLVALANANRDKTHDKGDEPLDPAVAAAVASILQHEDALIAHAQALTVSLYPGSQHGGSQKDAANNNKVFGPQPGGGGGGGDKQPPQAAAALAAQQHAIAEQTRALAASAQAHAAGASNAKSQQVADKAAAIAKTMEEAARAFAAGNADQGHDKAAEALAALQAVNTTLQDTDRDKLEAAISRAESDASVLLDKQQDLDAETAALAKDLGDKTPDQRQQRDLQKQAYQQTVLGANAETLGNEINDLSQRAAQVNQPEASHALSDAQHVIKRSQPQVKMSDAVVDLNNAKPGSAGDEQKDAEVSLQKIVESLHAGSDSLAASREAQLARASRAAQDAKKGLNTLLAQAGLQKNGDQTKTGAQGKGDKAQADAQGQGGPGQAAAQGKGDQAKADAQGQGGPGQAAAQGKGDQAKADAQGQGGPGQAGAQGKGDQAQADADAQGNGGPGQAGAQPNGGQAQAGTQTDMQGGNGGGGDDIQKLAFNIGELTTAVDNRQLVSQTDVDQLKAMTMDKAELEKRLAVDPKFLQNVSEIVERISDKIEAEMEAKSEAGKLFSSQREECPPNYRQLVNKYFEALSQVAPAPDSGTKPDQPGQP